MKLLAFVQTHLLLVAAWVICALAIIVSEWVNRKQAPQKLSPQQLVDLMNQDAVKVIDIRPAEQFQKAHILHAKNLVWNQKDLSAFQQKQGLVLVCQQGLTASQLAQKLKKQGMQDVAILSGGIEAWQSQQLPLVKGK